jgi:hypothetical protein
MTATVCLCVIRLVASEVSRHKTSRYLESHGLHLQRSHLINNAPAGPGAIGPPRPFRTLSFLPGMVLPDDMTIASTTFPVSGINLLENSAQSWYQAGYVNVRRRFSRGLTFLANYRFVQTIRANRYSMRTLGRRTGGSTPQHLQYPRHSRSATSAATRSTVPADRLWTLLYKENSR